MSERMARHDMRVKRRLDEGSRRVGGLPVIMAPQLYIPPPSATIANSEPTVLTTGSFMPIVIPGAIGGLLGLGKNMLDALGQLGVPIANILNPSSEAANQFQQLMRTLQETGYVPPPGIIYTLPATNPNVLARQASLNVTESLYSPPRLPPEAPPNQNPTPTPTETPLDAGFQKYITGSDGFIDDLGGVWMVPFKSFGDTQSFGFGPFGTKWTYQAKEDAQFSQFAEVDPSSRDGNVSKIMIFTNPDDPGVVNVTLMYKRRSNSLPANSSEVFQAVKQPDGSLIYTDPRTGYAWKLNTKTHTLVRLQAVQPTITPFPTKDQSTSVVPPPSSTPGRQASVSPTPVRPAAPPPSSTPGKQASVSPTPVRPASVAPPPSSTSVRPASVAPPSSSTPILEKSIRDKNDEVPAVDDLQQLQDLLKNYPFLIPAGLILAGGSLVLVNIITRVLKGIGSSTVLKSGGPGFTQETIAPGGRGCLHLLFPWLTNSSGKDYGNIEGNPKSLGASQSSFKAGFEVWGIGSLIAGSGIGVGIYYVLSQLIGK